VDVHGDLAGADAVEHAGEPVEIHHVAQAVTVRLEHDREVAEFRYGLL
jgi:hypothetical protein